AHETERGHVLALVQDRAAVLVPPGGGEREPEEPRLHDEHPSAPHRHSGGRLRHRRAAGGRLRGVRTRISTRRTKKWASGDGRLWVRFRCSRTCLLATCAGSPTPPTRFGTCPGPRS